MPTKNQPIHGNWSWGRETYWVWQARDGWYAKLPLGENAHVQFGPAMTQERAEEGLCNALDKFTADAQELL